MWDELQPLSLSGAAKALGVDPFEVVRLLVAADAMPAGRPCVPRPLVQRLRSLGGIEATWWDGVVLPADPLPRRARLRAALGLLLARKHVGERSTRLDNVSRGLPSDEHRILMECLQALADDGWIRIVARPQGVHVSVADVERIKALVDGRVTPSSVQEWLEG